MVLLRDFELEDIQQIDDIFKKQPELGVPSLKHVVANSTLESSDGHVIGYGVVKLFAEGVLVLDRSKSKKDRARAVRLSIDKAIDEAKSKDLEQLYFLTSNPSFADILRNKFGFKTVKEEVLMLNINPSEDE